MPYEELIHKESYKLSEPPFHCDLYYYIWVSTMEFNCKGLKTSAGLKFEFLIDVPITSIFFEASSIGLKSSLLI